MNLVENKTANMEGSSQAHLIREMTLNRRCLVRHVAGYVVIGLAVLAVVMQPAPVLAAHSDYGCAGCHTPHYATKANDAEGTWGVPLWNNVNLNDQALPTFTLYNSPTFDVLDTQITQPDGPSKLCLGCHDGTYSYMSTEHSFGAGGGMSLETSHPISFVYSDALASDPKLQHAGELKPPSTTASGLTASGTIATDMLDAKSKMQCTSCHDVHTSGIGETLLRKSYTDGKTLCVTCHNK
ncbi:MAG: hypothetical protein BIFFINMI_03146 [Phycisphaerae bacterium]|nr:hypothetical protein [Phycisphaerae bacterium]